MQLLEKKYLVEDFDAIEKLLREKNAKKILEETSIHYYGQHEGNNVEKFIEYSDRYEMHILKEKDGKFVLTEKMPLKDKDAGIAWLKKQGYTTANVVKMSYRKYSYKQGTIGLYTIDDFLHAVILYYPQGEHESVEQEFCLAHVKRITVPFNKLLEQLGKLRSVGLS